MVLDLKDLAVTSRDRGGHYFLMRIFRTMMHLTRVRHFLTDKSVQFSALIDMTDFKYITGLIEKFTILSIP